MAAKSATGTYHGRRSGPPGDTGEYWMPRDFARWEKAWDAYLDATVGPGLNIDGTPGRATGSVPTGRRGQPVEVDMSPEAVEERARAKARHAEALAYVGAYTGRWGLPLDIQRDRRFGTKHMKLSERQVDALLKGRDRDLERAQQAEISRELWQDDVYNHQRESIDQQANRMQRERQDAFLARKEAARVPDTSDTGSGLARPQDPGLASQPAPRPGVGRDVPDGWYMVDGQPWKVQWNRERTRKYAKRLLTGGWEYVPGGLNIIATKGSRMTVDDALQYGKLYGACAVCGATLTNEKSIERGIGPVCFGRIA